MISRKMLITIAGALVVALLCIWWQSTGGAVARYHPTMTDPLESSR